MSIRIQSAYRGYIERMYSYIRAFKIDQYPCIYIIKEQIQPFKEILTEVCRDNREYRLEKMNMLLQPKSEFGSLRYPDFTEYSYKELTLLHHLMPSLDTKVTDSYSGKRFYET